MLNGEAHGAWLPLMDYSVKNGVSLSTLRRHIKSGKVHHRLEEGRYLVWDSRPGRGVSPGGDEDRIHLRALVRQLECELGRAREEIAELKTLIAFYEETASARTLDV